MEAEGSATIEHMNATIVKFVYVLIATLILLNIFSKISKNAGNADEFALDEATTSIYANLNEIKIHCEGYSDSNECINSANSSPHEKVLWIGNSQLHAINQYQ